MSELRECPFCGVPPSCHPVASGKPSQYTIGCDNGKCYAQPFVVEIGEDRARARWNTRPASRVVEAATKFLRCVEQYHDAIKLRDDLENRHLWSRELSAMYDAMVKLRAALAAGEEG